MDFEEDFDFGSYAQSEQYQIDQAIFNDWQTRVIVNNEQLGVHFDQAYQDQANAAAFRLNTLQEYQDIQDPNMGWAKEEENRSLIAAQNLREPEAPMQVLTGNLKLASAKPPSEGILGELAASGLLASPYAMYNTIRSNSLSAHTEMFQEYAARWQYNFEIILGPANPAFVDATLNWDDMVRNLHLEYNENGVSTKVDSASRPTYEEALRTAEQNRVIEAATDKTLAEYKSGEGLFAAANEISNRADTKEAKTEGNTTHDRDAQNVVVTSVRVLKDGTIRIWYSNNRAMRLCRTEP